MLLLSTVLFHETVSVRKYLQKSKLNSILCTQMVVEIKTKTTFQKHNSSLYNVGEWVKHTLLSGFATSGRTEIKGRRTSKNFTKNGKEHKNQGRYNVSFMKLNTNLKIMVSIQSYIPFLEFIRWQIKV